MPTQLEEAKLPQNERHEQQKAEKVLSFSYRKLKESRILPALLLLSD